MRIGELGPATGVDVETIRYYQKADLLEFVINPAVDCSGIDRLIYAQQVRPPTRPRSMRALERQLAALHARCNAGKVAACGRGT